jgi:hypothetical protein
MDSHPHGYILRTFPLTVPIFHQGSVSAGMYGVASVVLTARQRDSLSSQQAARWPAERHVMPSRPAVTVHTGSSPTVATATPVLVWVRDVLGRDLGHDGPPV